MNTEYKVLIKSTVFFELKSLLGRTFIKSSPRLFNEVNYLNLGCGVQIKQGYVNADFFIFRPLFKRHRLLEWQLDFRYPFQCKENTFDGAFSEHVLEHLYPDDAVRFLDEVYRILKPGSLLRLTVPDLSKYIDFYTGKLQGIGKSEFDHQFKNGCQAIHNLTQNYYHLSTWDFVELQRVLSEAGFQLIKRQSFQEGDDPKLLLDSEDRAWETLYVEARKPLL